MLVFSGVSWLSHAPFRKLPQLLSRPDMIRTIRVLCSGLSVVTSTSGLGEILHEFVVGQTEFLVQ